MPRLDEPVDVAAVQLVVPPGPAARPHAAISAIGSIRYGTGRRESSSRSPRIQLDPCRASDQRAPAGVTSRPRRSRMATGRMWKPTSRPACVKVTPPSEPRLGTPFVASSCQLQVRAPWRRSTVRNCSARLIPKRIVSRPKLVARAAPSRYRCHPPFPTPRDASAIAAVPTCASMPRPSTESVAPVASRRSSDASELGAPSARSTKVRGVATCRDGSSTARAIAALSSPKASRSHPLCEVRPTPFVGSQWFKAAAPCRTARRRGMPHPPPALERFHTFRRKPPVSAALLAGNGRFPSLKRVISRRPLRVRPL